MNKNYKYILGVILFTTLFGGVFLFGQKAQAVNLKGVVNKLTGNIPSEEYFKGTNEYIDPSQFPKYTQNYNEIFFGSEGISVEELEELSQVVDLTTNQTETPQAVMSVGDEESVAVELSKDKQVLKQKFEEKKSELKKNKTSLKNEKSFETSKVLSVSFNSDPNDEKVAELNFYRGKDENREGLEKGLAELRDKVKTEQDATLKSKLEENLAKGEQMLKEKEEVLAKNRSKWELKKSEKSGIINKYAPKIQYAYSSPNKELMDILYPSKEAIDRLNADILAEREQIKKYKLDRIWKREEMKKELMSWLMPEEAYAGYLNNFVADMIIYSRANIGLDIDVDDGIATNGQQMKLWPVSSHHAQKFKFDDETGQIKFAANTNYCVDVDLANGQYDNADRVHLWNCHGGGNQKFVASPDGTIKPLYAQHMCLDGSAGVVAGSRIHLWSCHGGSNQKFQIGENDFGKFDYHMRLHASQTGSNNNNLLGHALVSMPKYEKANGKWHITNTFSFWGPMFNEYRLDGQYGIHFDNVVERTNNMRNKKSNGAWTSLIVDNGGGSYDADWNVGKAHPADAGGEFGGYRRTTFGLPKVVFEQIKYMNGYKVDGYVDKSWFPTCQTCASYSVILWNTNTNDSRFGSCWTPGAIYNLL